MINEIRIFTEEREVKRSRTTLGISGENGFETLKFTFDNFIEGQAVLELEKKSQDGSTKKYFIELEKGEECYLLEVKSSLLDVVCDIEMQLVIRNNNAEIFKSNVFTMTVKKAINATETIPEQYPTWYDKLSEKVQEIDDKLDEVSALQDDLDEKVKSGYFKGDKGDKGEQGEQGEQGEKGEKGEKPVKGVDYLTEDEKEEFKNAVVEESKTEIDKFKELKITEINDNTKAKLDEYNSNDIEKTETYNKNHKDKMKEYDGNATTKTDEFNKNVEAKEDEFNKNAKTKQTEFDENVTNQTDAFNENVTTKETAINELTEQKKTEISDTATEKINEFNENADELIAMNGYILSKLIELNGEEV